LVQILKVLVGFRCQCNTIPDSNDGHKRFLEDIDFRSDGKVQQEKVPFCKGLKLRQVITDADWIRSSWVVPAEAENRFGRLGGNHTEDQQ